MKRQALAAMIASLFALAACGGEQAAQAPAETPAASAEAASSAAQATAETPAGELPVIDAVTTHAPEVPPAIDRDYPAKVRVKMETVEKTMKMDDGVEYRYWTFDGDVPGRMIRVREGDTVEVEFSNNPSSYRSAQRRLPRRNRSGRRCSRDLYRPGPHFHIQLQSPATGPVHLPLRRRAGRYAHRQRYVRSDFGRA